jgi:hypothetical protein
VADTLKDFLIALKFNIDADGLRRFSESITASHKVVKDFAIGVAGMATAVEEAIRRTARQFENLYYLSQQGNVAVANLSAWQFAFKQVGLSADDLNQTVLAVAKNFRDNPGLRGLAQGLVPGAKDATEVILGLAQQYRTLMDRFGESGPQLDQASIGLRRMGERLGVPAENLYRLGRNYRELVKGIADQRSIVEAFGLDQRRAAENAVAAERSWNTVWESLKIALDVLIVESFPAIQELLKDFAAWFKNEGAASIREWAGEIRKFVENKDNIKEIEHRFSQVGVAISAVASGISSLVSGISELNKHLGATGTLLTVIFGVFVAKAAATALVGGIARLFGFAGAGLGAAAGGLGGLLGGAGAGAAGTGGLLGILGGLLGGGAAAGAAGAFVPDKMLTPEQQTGRQSAVVGILNWLGGQLGTKSRFRGPREGEEPGIYREVPGEEGAPASPGTSARPGGARRSSFSPGGVGHTVEPGGVAPGGRMPGRVEAPPSQIRLDPDLLKRMSAVGHGLMKDLGLTAAQAGGIVANLGAESQIKAINEKSPMIPGSRGGFGWAQWTGSRRREFEAWSAQQGLNPSSPEANYGFLLHELQSSKFAGFMKRLRQQETFAGATALTEHEFEGPAVQTGRPGYARKAQRALDVNFNAPPLGVGGAKGAMNIDSDHNTNINIYGASNPQGTADAVTTVQRRESALHTRNLRTALA